MTRDDAAYVEEALKKGLIASPCLELGVGYGGETNEALLEGAGLTYFGTDVMRSPGVDFAVDFEASPEVVTNAVRDVGTFGSVLVLNVLEHTFQPITVLDNVFNILRPWGTCLIIAPTVWPLHSYPRDYWRINPDFYEEYAKRRGYMIMEEVFSYVGGGKIRRDDPNAKTLPVPFEAERVRRLYSRVIHRVFNTFGRGMLFPSHLAIGVVMRKVGPRSNLLREARVGNSESEFACERDNSHTQPHSASPGDR
jgi:SAM-dependent methyltransferase